MTVEKILEQARKGQPSVIGKITQDRLAQTTMEYENTVMQRVLEEEKKKLEEVRGQGQTRSGTSIIQEIMSMDPKRAKELIDSLDEEGIQKIAALKAAESGRGDALFNLMKTPGTSIKDIVEIVKLMRPEGGGGSDLRAVAEVFKLGMEAARQGAPTKSAEEILGNLMEKYIIPFYQGMQLKDKEVFETRLQLLQDKIVDPLEWQKQQKQIMGEMGYVPASSQAGKSDTDIRLEEMRQSHDLDMKKIDWEMRKFLLEREADREKWDGIRETFGPIFQMAAPEVQNQLRSFGASMGKSLQQNPNPNPQPQQEMALFRCPKCKTEQNIPLPPGFEGEIKVRCMSCGTVTPAGFGEAPPPESTASESMVEELPQTTKLKPTYR